MKCKYCQAKVSTLHGGYCRSCKRNGLAEEQTKNPLNQFTTQELEQEILSRKQCHFGRLTCTTKAEAWIETPRTPTCFNCQQDLLSLKDYDQ